MGNIYRIPFFKTWFFFGVLVISAIQLWLLFLAISVFGSPGFLICLGFTFLMGLIQVLIIMGAKLRIELTDENLLISRPGEKFRIRWEDIQRIERIWTMYGGSFVYQIVTHDGRRLPAIPDNIENCLELLRVIQERSGKRIISETDTIGVSIKEDWQKLVRFFDFGDDRRRRSK